METHLFTTIAIPMSPKDFQRSHLRTVQGYQLSKPLPYSNDIIKLNSNENPYPPSPHVLATLRTLNPDYLRRYQDPTGTAFRKSVADLHQINPDWLCVGNGADHLLELIFRCFVSPGDKVVYPSPTYSLYTVLAQLEMAQAIEFNYGEKYELPVEDLIQSQGQLTLIASPASPTGQAISLSVLETLATSVKGLLIIDEAYCDFAEHDALSLLQHHTNIILVRTLSKGYSLAGVRLGYAIAHPELIAVLNKVKDSYSVDAIALQLGISAIQDQDYKNETVAQIQRSRQILSEGLEALGCFVYPSATNFLWVKPNTNAEQITQSLKGEQIYIRHYAAPKLRNHVRITVGTEAQNQKLLQVLNSIL